MNLKLLALITLCNISSLYTMQREPDEDRPWYDFWSARSKPAQELKQKGPATPEPKAQLSTNSHTVITIDENTQPQKNGSKVKRLSLKVESTDLGDDELHDVAMYVLQRKCPPDKVDCHKKILPQVKRKLSKLPASELQTARQLSSERQENGGEKLLDAIFAEAYNKHSKQLMRKFILSAAGFIGTTGTTVLGTLLAYYLPSDGNNCTNQFPGNSTTTG